MRSRTAAFLGRAALVALGGALSTTAPSAGLPSISAANATPAGVVARIAGLERDPVTGRVAHVGVVNPGRDQAACRAAFYRPDGTPFAEVASFDVPPRSVRHLEDVLASLGAQRARGALAEVTCDQAFSVYGVHTDAGQAGYEFLEPSPLPALGPCTDDALCYDFPGVVHTSTKQKPAQALVLEPPAGEYSRLTVHLEFEVNGWSPPATGAHGVLYMVREKNRDMFANVFLQGPAPRGNALVFRHGFDQSHGEKAKFRRGFIAKQGKKYILDYSYDPAAQSLTLKISNKAGPLVVVEDVPNVDRIEIAPGQEISLGLSNPGFAANEPASLGWVYSNVRVELFP